MKSFLLTLIFILITPFANASEFCVDQYQNSISKVDSELGKIVKRQSEIDQRLAAIFIDIANFSAQLSEAAAKNPPDIGTIQSLGAKIADLNREKTELQAEGYKLLDRSVVLKGKIPSELQGKLLGCIQATAPTNQLVNLSIQTLAILTTGGASLVLPEKSLYVDMSAVLNGYPFGGDKSVVNQAREAALKMLPFGMGDKDNDLGKILRDPGRLLRCPFGC